MARQGPVRLDAHWSNMTIGWNSLPLNVWNRGQAVPASADPIQLGTDRAIGPERMARGAPGFLSCYRLA